MSNFIQSLNLDAIKNEKIGLPEHPSNREVESTIEPSNWLKLPFPYTFSVHDIKLFKTGEGFTDFPLPLAPQSINQTEDFAITIRPTQGGTTITHSGNRYKTLSLKGTTGIHAFRGAGGVLKSTGEAIFQPKELKYKSGYETFLRLRNWFRAYYEFKKKSPTASKNLRLVFKNFKDGEFLIVECQRFEMIRQAAKPFLYDYNLEFKVIAPLFDESIIDVFRVDTNLLEDAMEALDQARGILLRGSAILRQIEGVIESIIIDPLRKVSLILKAAIAIPLVAADIGDRLINNTMSTLDTIALLLGIAEEQKQNKITGTLDKRISDIELPANPKSVITLEGPSFIKSFGEGLMALEVSRFPQITQDAVFEEQIQLANTPRSFYENLTVELIKIKQNAEDFFNLGDSNLDIIFERSASLTADLTKVATPQEFEILNGLNNAIQAMQIILSTEILFKSSFEERLTELTDNFQGNLDLFSSPAVKQITLQAGVTLEKLAQVHLGESIRWGEIAELNQLRAPYVTDDLSSTAIGVAKPGDRILIPADIIEGFSPVPKGKITVQNENLSEVEKSLSTDFKLTEDFDLALTPGGDFDLISSIDNIVQAIKLKLGYEKGEVIRHPGMGAGIISGVKFPPLLTIQEGVVNTILQDARIERVDDLRLERNGSELRLSFNLKIKQVDLPVPLTIFLR